jgi:hypothetical protein
VADYRIELYFNLRRGGFLQLHHQFYTRAGLVLTARREIGPREIGAAIGWRRENRDRIAELEALRLRLEEARTRAQVKGTDEGDRLEAELRAELQRISKLIHGPRASLE